MGTDTAVAAPVRTPIGKFGGALSSLSAVELGATAARGTLARSGIEPADAVIFGTSDAVAAAFRTGCRRGR